MVADRIRAAVYHRDGRQCLICGRGDRLSIQHRNGRGMGGDPTRRRDALSNLITICGPTNSRLERDLQDLGLLLGWKVPRTLPSHRVPVRATHLGLWLVYAPDQDCGEVISHHEAYELHAAAYGAPEVARQARNAIDFLNPIHPEDWRCP